MTWSAPSDRKKSILPVLSTPVTSAPYIKLHGKRTSTTTRAIDQNFLTRLNLSFLANPSQSDHSRLWDRCRFLERHTGWFPRQGFSTGANVLSKTSMIVWEFPKHFISGLKF